MTNDMYDSKLSLCVMCLLGSMICKEFQSSVEVMKPMIIIISFALLLPSLSMRALCL